MIDLRKIVIEGLASLPDEEINNLTFHYHNDCEIATGPDAVVHQPKSA